MHQLAHLAGLHRAVAEDQIGAGIDRHDAIEHARLGVAIELNENLALFHGSSVVSSQ